MSLHLWILRHGEAERVARSDAERELTERGAADATRAGEWLAQQAACPQRLLASPYRRAQQTATCVQRALPSLAIETVDWLTPDDNPLSVAKQLSALAGSVLLVSHQPLVGALVGVLVYGSVEDALPLPTAGLAEIDVPMTAPGFASLRSLRSPPDYSRAVNL